MLHSTLHLLRSAVSALLLLALVAGGLPLREELLDPRAVDWPIPEQLLIAQPGDTALGYQPAVREHAGTLEAYRADGSCSTPVPASAPFGLEAACQVHDLAYDRLRVARGQGSGTEVERRAARLHADLTFIRRSHQQCLLLSAPERLGCHGLAHAFGTAVLINSTRQGFGDAPPESPVQLGLWTLGLLTALGGVSALRRWRRAVGKHERQFLDQVLPGAQVRRIYVGVRHGWRRRARLAHLAAALDHTGAFAAGTVCLVVTTGSGWVNPHALATLANVSSGPLTVVAVQYSRLPSWAVLLLRPGLARRTATAAIRAVADHRDAVARWKGRASTLVVHGESLGAGAIATALARAPSLAGRLDGGLLVSPPGSAERTSSGRMVLVRHVDDAVVWCTPTLIWRPVRWRGAAGVEPGAVDTQTAQAAHVATAVAEVVHVAPPWRRWRPVWTFLHVLRALPAAGDHPFGHGHRYGAELSDGWAQVIPGPAAAGRAGTAGAEQQCGTMAV